MQDYQNFFSKRIFPAHLKAAKLLQNLFSIAFILVCSFSIAGAQTGSSSGTTETRARRAAVATNDAKDGEQTSTVMEDAAIARPAQAEPEDETTVPVKDAKRSDRIEQLRAQIKNAKTEVERVRAQRTLVDYLVALNRQSEAVAELRLMLSAERLDAASYYNIGNGLARLGDAEKAVEAYRRAIDARQGNYPRALNNLGVVLLGLGQMDEAYDALVLAIKQQNFRYAEASYNLGKLYAMRDEADLAISEWTRALAVQPDHADAAIALARAYALTGKTERALEVIDATLRRTGKNERLEAVREELSANSASKR